MIFTDKRKCKNIFTLTLITFHIIFLLSILLVEGYPQNNDILYIFKITSLEGNLKFINGLYGPGYAYYTLIFSNSLTLLTVIIYCLGVLSSYLIHKILSCYQELHKRKKNFL